MGIVFFCQSCGARFEVDRGMAGKKGRCKQCGQAMTIPRAEEIASMVAMPAMAAVAVGAGVASDAGAGDGSSIGSWLKEGSISKVALAPLTVNRVPLFKRKPDPLDDAEDSKPYVLAKPPIENRGPVRVQDHVVVRVWRRQLGGIQKVFRTINETLYLVSTPFIMIFLFGIAVRSQHMAWFGAAAVVLLNIGRLVSGAVNLAVVPFRDGLDLSKMKKPLGRVLGPAFMICLVACAFTFIPWLHQGGSEKARARGLFGSGGSLRTEAPGRAGQGRLWKVRKPAHRLGNRPRDSTDRSQASRPSISTDEVKLRDRLMYTSPIQEILADAEVIELEPTMDVAMPWSVRGSASSHPPGKAEGSLASLAGETHSLRRSRLAAAALFLALAFAVVLVWRLFSFGVEGTAWVTLATGGLRFAIASAVAGLLMSRTPLTQRQVLAAEYILFGSFTLLMAVSQYVVNLDLLRHGDVPGVISFVKNGVSATVILMIIYGMFIPNDPRSTAKVVLTMALVLVFTLVLVMEHPEVETMVEQLHSTEHSGSNILFLMIGAALAIYGSYLLNGLRTELHEARKFGQYQLVRKIGRRRDGRGLPRRAPAAETSLCAEADQAGGGDRPDRPGAVRARGPVGRAALAPQHDRDLRLRPHRRRHVLLRDGIPPGPEPGRPGSSARSAAAGAGDLPVPPGLCGACRGPRPGPGAPGLEAGQRVRRGPRRRGRRRQGARLRAGQADPRPRRRGADRASMTVSGTPMYMAPEQAVGRPLARRPRRHLRPRRDDLLRTDRPAAVHGRERVRGDDGPRPRPGRAPVAAPSRLARRPRAASSSAAWPRSPGTVTPASRPSARPWPLAHRPPNGRRPGRSVVDGPGNVALNDATLETAGMES